MSRAPAILIVGTCDTKTDEISFLAETIAAQGGKPIVMDVGVADSGSKLAAISNAEVAEAAGTSIAAVRKSADENEAMQAMARGAAHLCAERHAAGSCDGMLALGGSMGTDLALDCALALPLGVPKLIVSTVAFSPLLPPWRMAPDVQMILWAGGLYGLNDVCRSSLSLAAGAVLGAARAAQPPQGDRPVVGMTSLGSSCLSYMTRIRPALAERGYGLAVFHSTGMGGIAFELLAGMGHFCCVMDFCLQEVVNEMLGAPTGSGADRMLSAARSGTPQLVAPGAVDLVDFPTWGPVPQQFADWAMHDHNRLIRSASLPPDARRRAAREIAGRLAQAGGTRTHFILPSGGVEEWDRPGQPLHDPDGLAAFCDEMRAAVAPPAEISALDAHINDPAFSDEAIRVFDAWAEQGALRMQGQG